MAERIASASEQLVAGVEESSVAAQEFTRLMEGATQEAASAGVNSEKMHEASTALSSAASSLDLIMDELIIKGTNAIQTTEESVGTMKSMIGWTKIATAKNVQSSKRISELEVQSQRMRYANPSGNGQTTMSVMRSLPPWFR